MIIQGKTNWKYIFILAIVAIFVGGIMVGAFEFMRCSYFWPSSQQIQSNIGETAGWQTYRNEEYGFEIKYPQSFFIFEDSKENFGGGIWKRLAISEIDTHTYPGRFNINVLFEDQTEVEAMANEINQLAETDPRLVFVDNIKAKKSGPLAPFGGWYRTEIFIVENDKLYGIFYELPVEPSDILNEELYSQMLSTFRFAE